MQCVAFVQNGIFTEDIRLKDLDLIFLFSKIRKTPPIIYFDQFIYFLSPYLTFTVILIF